jgi:hypothetical protein
VASDSTLQEPDHGPTSVYMFNFVLNIDRILILKGKKLWEEQTCLLSLYYVTS